MNDKLKEFPTPKSKDFKLENIQSVNPKPHFYVITPRHVGHCSDHNCGMLNEQAIRDAEKDGALCGWRDKNNARRCELPYDEHTCDKVLFIRALVNKPIKDLIGLKEYLLKIKPVLEKLHLAGVAFIEPEKKEAKHA